MRRRTARSALVKENDLISRRIEKLSISRNKSAARAAVKENDRNSIGITNPLVIDRVNVRHGKHSTVERLNFGVQICHKLIIREMRQRKKPQMDTDKHSIYLSSSVVISESCHTKAERQEASRAVCDDLQCLFRVRR